MAAVRNHFKPEFLNRVDEIVVFDRLTEADIERIVDIQVASARATGSPGAGSASISPERRGCGSRRRATTPTSGPGR